LDPYEPFHTAEYYQFFADEPEMKPYLAEFFPISVAHSEKPTKLAERTLRSDDP
jgi:hypothetical protein